MDSKSELLEGLREKIADGHGMVKRLRLMGKIDGIDKLIRKIQQEIKFLEKVSKRVETHVGALRFAGFLQQKRSTPIVAIELLVLVYFRQQLSVSLSQSHVLHFIFLIPQLSLGR